MIFRRTIFAALLIGLVAGLAFSIIQYSFINPIILEAETFEVQSGHSHAAHDHILAASEPIKQWSPADGAERAGYSIVANVIVGVGYAAILLALMAQFQQQGLVQLNIVKGWLWGTAGFVTFFVGPAIGLPPEIPGIEAEPVEHRQIWWLMCVCCVGVGLLLLGLTSLKGKLLGLALLTLPYVVPIPHSVGPMFTHPDAQTVLTLTQLHQQFIVLSSLGNWVLWSMLGVMSAWLLNGWVLKGSVPAATLADCAGKGSTRKGSGVLGA